MNKIIITLLVIVGGGLLILALQFGTVTPCGVLRAEVRQAAAREGGLTLIVSALPDEAIDALLAARFGPMSPARCLQLTLSGPLVQPEPAPRPNPMQAAEQRARIAAAQLANFRSLTNRMSVFVTGANAMLQKFAPAEERYQYITAYMRGALAREQSIYGGGQASVARGQMSVAINQASIQANQIHIGVQSSYRDFDLNAGQLERESMGAGQGCRGVHVATGATPVPAVPVVWKDACLHYFDVARQFQQRVADLRVAFARLETIWQTQHRTQDEIVQASNVAVQ